MAELGEFSLKELGKSVQVLGHLYPVLVSSDGEVLDGLHRKRVDPKWPEKIVEVKTKYEKCRIRLWANYRRQVSSKEVQQLLTTMAEQLKQMGYPPGQIVKKLAEEVPYSVKTIYRLLPPEYKRAYVKTEEKLKPVEKLIKEEEKVSHETFQPSHIKVTEKAKSPAEKPSRKQNVPKTPEEALQRFGPISQMNLNQLRTFTKLLMDRVKELSEPFVAKCPHCGRPLMVLPEAKAIGADVKSL